jgi:hypothetical protein
VVGTFCGGPCPACIVGAPSRFSCLALEEQSRQRPSFCLLCFRVAVCGELDNLRAGKHKQFRFQHCMSLIFAVI